MKLRLLLLTAGLLPWLSPWLSPRVKAALDAALAPVCHQIPSRTLVIAGQAMSVCSRCAGVYAGIALGALLAWPRTRAWRSALPAAAGIMLVDIMTQDLALHPAWHATRLATGAAVGYCASAWLVTDS